MKQILSSFIIVLLITPVISMNPGSCKKVNITGKIFFTPLYKGGARPTPEILEACCSTRPMASSTLYLKKNYYSKLQYIITTDGSGNFEKLLRPGVYHFFLKNETDVAKAKELSNGKIDQENAWRTEPYYTLEVKPRKNDFIEITIMDRMSPEERLRP